MTVLKITQIKVDQSILGRATLDEGLLVEYEELRRTEEAVFPPIVVFKDTAENYWLGDGNHRLHVEKKIGNNTIDVDLREGSKSDARWFAAGANLNHGQRPSRGDRLHAIQNLLLDPAHQKRPFVAIGKQCGVSKQYVAKVANALIKAGKLKPAAVGRKTVKITTGQHAGKTYEKASPGTGAKAKKTTSPATAAPKPNAAKKKDQRGHVIPEYLLGVWAGRSVVMDMVTELSAIPAKVQKLTVHASGAGSMIEVGTVKDLLGEARTRIKKSAPYVICSDCRPSNHVCKGCKQCDGKGWLSEDEYFEWKQEH